MEEAVLLGVPTAAAAQLDASFLGGDAVSALCLVFRAPGAVVAHAAARACAMLV